MFRGEQNIVNWRAQNVASDRRVDSVRYFSLIV